MPIIYSECKIHTNQQNRCFRAFLVATKQVLFIALLFFPTTSLAAISIESLDVSVNIDDFGKSSILQKIKYSSPSKLDWQVFSDTRNLKVVADGKLTQKPDIKTKKKDGKSQITSTVLSSVWEISYESSGNLIRHNNRDQLFLKILDQPFSPVFQTNIDFNLPKNPKEETGISGNIYSLSGVNNPKTQINSATNITYSAGYAGVKSLITISSTWNKNILQLSPVEQAKLSLLQLNIAPWLLFGLLLPISSLAVLFHLLWRQKRQEKSTNKITNKRPLDTPAILVGVLIRKKIYPEEIAALIISLCQRGYLIIIKKSDDFFITQRKKIDENLENWERAIIEEMFGNSNDPRSENMQSINNNNLYSLNVRKAFSQIYGVVTNASYFSENPHITRIKNKLFALAIYYLSAVAIIWVAISAASPYLILPLAGAMVVAQIIIKLSVKLANYSEKGIKTRIEWLAFKNYLNENKPLPFEVSRNHTFDKYLPYAVAMNSTLAWAKRFDLSSIVIIKPDWFVTYDNNSTVEFAKEIARFTNKISEGITSLRGPLVN